MIKAPALMDKLASQSRIGPSALDSRKLRRARPGALLRVFPDADPTRTETPNVLYAPVDANPPAKRRKSNMKVESKSPTLRGWEAVFAMAGVLLSSAGTALLMSFPIIWLIN